MVGDGGGLGGPDPAGRVEGLGGGASTCLVGGCCCRDGAAAARWAGLCCWHDGAAAARWAGFCCWRGAFRLGGGTAARLRGPRRLRALRGLRL